MIQWPDLPAAAAAAPSAPLALPPAFAASRFALPDGTPLQLTMSRKSHYVQLTGSVRVASAENALVLLYLASPLYDPRARWRVPAPDDTRDEPLAAEEEPNWFTEMRGRIEDWADTIHHTQLLPLWDLALQLWDDTHATMTQPLPETGDTTAAEKKNTRGRSRTGRSSSSASSPPATSPAAAPSSTTSPSVTSTPPTTRGVSSKASRSSPRTSSTAASRKRTK